VVPDARHGHSEYNSAYDGCFNDRLNHCLNYYFMPVEVQMTALTQMPAA
jgi:hypothetical protein